MDEPLGWSFKLRTQSRKDAPLEQCRAVTENEMNMFWALKIQKTFISSDINPVRRKRRLES